MPNEREVEAASSARLDGPPRELWAEIDARSRRIERQLAAFWILIIVAACFFAGLIVFAP